MRNCVPVMIVLSTLALAAPAAAKDYDWYKYENDYFEAYSDASERSVTRLLEELENFRAAVVQLLAIEIRPGTRKTRLIVFRSRNEFRELAGNKRIAAFMTGVDGVPHMVMPNGNNRNVARHLVRHEYTHVVLGYSEHRFPLWYHEGFAEFMSGTNFTEKGTKFSVGDTIARRQVGRLLVPWEELLDDNFNVHAISNADKASNAYYQAWMLVHYLTIGDRFEHYPKLSRYLGRVSAGEESLSAIRAEFDMEPDELGRLALREYGRRMPYYEMEFEPGVRDREFERSKFDSAAIAETIAAIREQRPPDP